MSRRFENLHCVVTGGGRGIGAATVAQLRSEGATVHIADLLVTSSDGDSCDVTQPEQLRAFFSRLDRLDVLVCVAGGLIKGTLDDSEAWRRSMELNVDSVWHTVRAAAPVLRHSPAASIVTIGSYAALRPTRDSLPYSAAKGALLSLTRSLAVELAPQIRVNAVIPGQVESVRTAGHFASFRDPEKARRRTLESFPLRRLGRPEDIAKAIAFLASSDASWITGTYLYVDGGRDAAGLDLSGCR